uniref:Nicotinate phosphoribosyltransferase n=1 Tax=Erythrolobus australicus TaxID=1077150 RepID=A0A7S1TL32_9RHOD
MEADFEYFFRKAPFGGAFCVFNGVWEVVRLAKNLRFEKHELAVVRELLLAADSSSATKIDAFIAWLASVNGAMISMRAFPEGSVVFPNEPLLTLKGPIAVIHLLESALLNALNFATLVATKAARLVVAAGPRATVLEFGLRRAQGPGAAMLASKYAFAGGVHASSNLLACSKYGIAPRGTQAHAFVQAFDKDDLRRLERANVGSLESRFVKDVLYLRNALCATDTHDGELAAFTSYALSFPTSFIALVDTYDTLRSGVPNFCVVACALIRACAYRGREEPLKFGLRLDSGDLGALSCSARRVIHEIARRAELPALESAIIVASNDLDEDSITSLGAYVPAERFAAGHVANDKEHSIDAFGVGTRLAACTQQPALGGVLKLVELQQRPCFKTTDESAKATLPFRKQVYRLLSDKRAVADVIARDAESFPQQTISRRAGAVDERRVVARGREPPYAKLALLSDGGEGKNALLSDVWSAGEARGRMRARDDTRKDMIAETDALHASRRHAKQQFALFPSKILRAGAHPMSAKGSNVAATPYIVALSEDLHTLTRALVEENSRMTYIP